MYQSGHNPNWLETETFPGSDLSLTPRRAAGLWRDKRRAALAEDLRNLQLRSLIYCTDAHMFFPWHTLTHRGEVSHKHLHGLGMLDRAVQNITGIKWESGVWTGHSSTIQQYLRIKMGQWQISMSEKSSKHPKKEKKMAMVWKKKHTFESFSGIVLIQSWKYQVV